MVSPPRADANLLLVLVLWCLCCAPLTCKIKRGQWMSSILDQIKDNFLWIASKEGNPETMNLMEFREYLKFNKFCDPEDIEDLDLLERTLRSMDLDKDGELNYYEFHHFLKQISIARYRDMSNH